MSEETLTDAQRELLTILAEECGEVVQRVTKILRFGLRVNPWDGKHNRDTLELEVGDISAILRLLHDEGVVDLGRVWKLADQKIEKMRIRDGRLLHAVVGFNP